MTIPDAPLLTATNVRRTFRMGTADLPVLRAVDFQLRPGEFVAIEGRSGSGKSTLLHVLAALDSVDGGTMTFAGADYTRRTPRPPGRVRMALVGGRGERPWAFRARVVVYLGMIAAGVAFLCLGWPLVQHAIDPVRWPDEPTRRQAHDLWGSGGVLAAVAVLIAGRWAADLVMFARRLLGERPAAALRNGKFGFVFQSYHLLPELNVLENTLLSPSITFTSRAFWSRRAKLRARATDLLTRLGLEGRLRHRVANLSGGERQRVAIARALMNDPAGAVRRRADRQPRRRDGAGRSWTCWRACTATTGRRS